MGHAYIATHGSNAKICQPHSEIAHSGMVYQEALPCPSYQPTAEQRHMVEAESSRNFARACLLILGVCGDVGPQIAPGLKYGDFRELVQ